ncbi:Cytidylate kinase [hydrothermal vent metagenome]|uniref:(d)CMP kinase n=1 Tax=hydrothermal vent metagenome TaxID=652676 RepID=A0A3B0Y4L2_9ZZZZ
MNNNIKDPPVITVDGPSGSGKGTICLQLAKQFGFNLLDSGALYRLVALAVENSNADISNPALIANIALNLDTHFETQSEDVRVFLNKNDVTDAIRTETCGNQASKVAAIPEVRRALLERQRNFVTEPGLIADGRDMGTVVFPSAVVKIFLTASAEERAERRYKQLKQKGLNVNLAHLSREIQERDERDKTRSVSPLVPAKDAIILDTSTMSIEAVVKQVITLVKTNGV